LALAIALRPAEDALGTAAIAQLLVVPVVVIAVSGRRLVTTLAALSAAAAFDVLYIEPRGSFQVNRADEAVMLGSLLLVGLVVAQLSSFAHRQQATAGRTVSDMTVLRSVGELVAHGEDPEEVVMTSAYWLRDMLSLRDCRLSWDVVPPSPAQIDLGGVVRIGELRWSTETQGLPGPTVDLPIHVDGRTAGRFVLVPEPGLPIAPDRLMTAMALADLVGLTRSTGQAIH
jgi:hypothetical protein